MGPLPMMMGQQGIPMVNPAYLQLMQSAQPMNFNPMMPPSRAQLEMQMAQVSLCAIFEWLVLVGDRRGS